MFYAVYGAGTEESNRALIAILNVILDRREDPIVNGRLFSETEKLHSIFRLKEIEEL